MHRFPEVPSGSQDHPRPGSLRAVLDDQVSETELQATIIAKAKALGWLCYHTHTSKHSAKGFPDLVLVRAPRVIFAELKRQRGKASTEQKVWLGSLEMCDGVECHLWRPSDWPAIERALR